VARAGSEPFRCFLDQINAFVDIMLPPDFVPVERACESHGTTDINDNEE
jgi:hypothetical protein